LQGRKPEKAQLDPNTSVSMTDGGSRPIKDVNVGDRVLATDPATGITKAEPVTLLHRNVDHDLVKVKVKDRNGETSFFNTTRHHPFWDATDRKWVDAGNLHAGHHLRATLGAVALTVTAVDVVHGSREMRDLTVAHIHAYYVVAGAAPVLVHNCGEAAVDTNAVTDALSAIRTADVDAALAGRRPVLSPTAHRELLEGGHTAEAIEGWLSDRGGRMGAEATADGVASLQGRLKAMWKGKSFRPVIGDDDAGFCTQPSKMDCR
jgi:hypothetical protein